MTNISSFSETLVELMSERNLTIRMLARVIDVSCGNIGMWTSGACRLSLTNACKLADFFECSLEYLMGRTDTRLSFVPKSCPVFYERLMQIMCERGISRYRVVMDTDFSNSYFTRWKKGGIPLMETVINLAAYFDCTLDFLVGREG